MGQQRWMNFINDYALQNHLGMANVVANALRRKTLHMATMLTKDRNSRCEVYKGKNCFGEYNCRGK
jgi:hypothetical protein